MNDDSRAERDAIDPREPDGAREEVAGLAEPPAGLAPQRSRRIYLLPNAFTTANLFAGFYAIVQAMNDNFEAAAIAIFVAMVLDSLDGRVARMTNTQSAFGEQYDSMSDMVSFGAAPALVIYEWSLRGLGKWGWLAAFIYVAGAALRLARFNTNLGVVDKRFFQGLPSPAAAALVVGMVWLATDLRENRLIDMTGKDLSWLAWVMTVYTGLTMVSNAPFYSFKTINLRKSVPFMAALVLVLVFVLISSDPPMMLFGLFLCYGLSGYVVWALRYRAIRARRGEAASDAPSEATEAAQADPGEQVGYLGARRAQAQVGGHGDHVELHLEHARVLERVERVVVQVAQPDLFDQVLVLVVADVVDEAERPTTPPVDVGGVPLLDVGEEIGSFASSFRKAGWFCHGVGPYPRPALRAGNAVGIPAEPRNAPAWNARTSLTNLRTARSCGAAPSR